jgi:DNA repair exonuclease SbcCD nuclease subunit
LGIFGSRKLFRLLSQDKIDPETKLPERLSGLCNAMDAMIIYGKTYGVNRVTIIGDVFHNKSIIHSIAQSVFLDIVRKNPDIEFIILDGNHDMSSMTGDGVSSTKCLDNEKNVITIHETRQIENILFVPWNPNNMVSDIKNGKADYLFSHLGLNEAMLNSGISLVSDIGLKDLKQYKKAFLGHYHLAQEVANTSYIGSLIHLDGNDKNQEKRFINFNSETGKELSIISTGYKKYWEFNLTKDNKNDLLKKIFDLKSEGNHVKLNKMDDVDISDIVDDFSIVNKVETDITNRGITSGMSSGDKLDRYMEIKGIPVEKRAEYKNIALDIIDKVSSEIK